MTLEIVNTQVHQFTSSLAHFRLVSTTAFTFLVQL